MNAFDLIRRFERFSAKPYWDVNAYRTGYGSDTVTLADGRVVPVTPDTTVSPEDAQRDLERRVATEFAPRAVAKVGPDAWARLSEPQQAALISITYNYGELPDSVAAKVAAGDVTGTAQAIAALGSHNDGVNAKRRAAEAQIFAGGQLPDGALPSDPQARNAAPLAVAYRSGKMTPEDAALYEQGVKEGLFPKVERAPQDDPANVYASIAMNRPRNQAPLVPLSAGQPVKSPIAFGAQPLAAAPLRYPGI